MSKTVAIHQPNYLPWLGYFHKMHQADIFVLLDNVQFPKGSYANRVKIKSRLKRTVWLTVPVRLSKGSDQDYNEIEIAYDQKWQVKHMNLLRDTYQTSPFFDRYFEGLVSLIKESYPHLAALNVPLIQYLKGQLGITTRLEIASEIGKDLGTGSERNLAICQRLGADIYLSGQGARAYNDEEAFTAAGIELVYDSFTCPVYPQPHDDFVPNLSMVDLLFNCGPESLTVLEKA